MSSPLETKAPPIGNTTADAVSNPAAPIMSPADLRRLVERVPGLGSGTSDGYALLNTANVLDAPRDAKRRLDRAYARDPDCPDWNEVMAAQGALDAAVATLSDSRGND